MALLDQFGAPVDFTTLTRELAAPSLASVRNIFSSHAAQGLTPDLLGAYLAESEYGYPWNWMDIAEEMEEKYLHYQSVLSTRKRAVIGLEPQVEAADETSEAQAHADFIRELLISDDFTDTQFDLLDGLGKGYSVVEVIWDTEGKGGTWKPVGLKWRDPRWFVIDPNDGETLLLRDNTGFYPLPPYKFIVHKPKIKSGIVIRGGLARAASWAYCFQNYTTKNWLSFLEVYGMPLRLGKFNSTATEDDKLALKQALGGLGTDAAAIVPDWAQIEFKEASGKQTSSEVYKTMCDHLDDGVSKAVLGQTFTMGGSKGGGLGHSGKPQENVRIDILQSDARQLAGTISRTIVKWIIDLNFQGPHEIYPSYKLPVKEADDLAALGNFLQVGLPYSPGITAKWFRDKIGAPDPQDGDVLLAAAPPAAAPQPGTPPTQAKPIPSADPIAHVGDEGAPEIKPSPYKKPPTAPPPGEDGQLTKRLDYTQPGLEKPRAPAPPPQQTDYVFTPRQGGQPPGTPPVPYFGHARVVPKGKALIGKVNALTLKYRALAAEAKRTDGTAVAVASVDKAIDSVERLALAIEGKLRTRKRRK